MGPSAGFENDPFPARRRRSAAPFPGRSIAFQERLTDLKERLRTEPGFLASETKANAFVRWTFRLCVGAFVPIFVSGLFLAEPLGPLVFIGGIVGCILTFVRARSPLRRIAERLQRGRLHLLARDFLASKAKCIAELEQEIAAYQDGLEHLDILQGKTVHYDALLEQCERRRKELQGRADAILTEASRLLQRVEDGKRLQALKDRLPGLLPAAIAVKGVTEDLTPYVALLEAQAHIDRTAENRPADDSPPDRDRE